MRHDAGHDRVGDLDRRARPRPRATAPRAGSPSASPSARGVVGMHVQRCSAACPSRAASRLCIQELFERSWRRPIEHEPPLRAARRARRAGAARRPRSAPARARPCPSACAAPRAARGSQRAEVDAVRRRLERRAERRGRTGPARSMQVEQPLGPAPRLERGEHLLGVAPVEPASAGGDLAAHASRGDERRRARRRRRPAPCPATIAGQAQQRLPLLGGSSRRASSTGGE